MLYCKEITGIICNLIVDGHSLRAIGKIKGLPSKPTIMRWLTDRRKIDFLDDYRRAKEVQHIIYVDRLMGAVGDGIHYRSLGQAGGRVHKLHLKTNANPRNFIAAEQERRARIQYGTGC
jgi:hypothetical protein